MVPGESIKTPIIAKKTKMIARPPITGYTQNGSRFYDSITGAKTGITIGTETSSPGNGIATSPVYAIIRLGTPISSDFTL